MVSAVSDSRPAPRANENDRTLTFFGILAGHLGSFGVLYFWLTGAILLFTGNGGQLVEIVRFSGTERLLYLGYPVVVLLSLFSWVFGFSPAGSVTATGLSVRNGSISSVCPPVSSETVA